MRLGLVGRGRWGHNIERTLLDFNGVEVVAIGRGAPRPSNLDGVLIATPSETHADLALPYIEAGLPTFIEKPMATSLADADRIRQSAERGGGLVFVGHVHLYNPAFQSLLDVLPALGPVRYVLCESGNDNPRSGTSVLWDWLPHDLSMAGAIFGVAPDDVQAWPLTGVSHPQAAVTRYRYGPASLVSMITWLSPAPRQHITVAAERGTVIFDVKAERKLVLYGQDGISYPAYGEELSLTRELRAFVDAVRSGAADPAQVALGVSVTRAIAAAETSLARQGATATIGP